MPKAPVQPLDLQRLAPAAAVLAFDFQLAEFARLVDRLATPAGAARAELALAVEEGVVVGDLKVRADVSLTCQRCLGTMQQRLTSESRLAFLDREGPAPGEREAIVGDTQRFAVAPLVEDELLLALPLIARHGAGERCEAPAAALAAEPPDTERRRPFAQLKNLLKTESE